ncbi:MAG: hypothetical protein ACSLE0_00425 [Chitinophagaceae bacterium]
MKTIKLVIPIVSDNFKMRQILTFLIISVLCSCGEQNEQAKPTLKNVVSNDSSIFPDNLATEGKAENRKTDYTPPDWKKQLDSLRNEIIKRKENRILKESFLQEMYIRNVVNVSKDSLFVDIPFNMHGPDCGAPDCYSTDVSFSFKLGSILVFPEKLQFQEHEHGCVEKESKLSGTFQLVEQTERHILYHSAKHKRTLVLFSLNDENGAVAYYFTEVGQNRITGKNVYSIRDVYNEKHKNSIYPFTSWVLTTNEYENFLN